MSAKVLKFPTKWRGEFHQRKYTATTKPSENTKRVCTLCGGMVRRSWRTGILHTRCRSCRYLILMYGTNIEVQLIPK